jgi:hypothetical protein
MIIGGRMHCFESHAQRFSKNARRDMDAIRRGQGTFDLFLNGEWSRQEISELVLSDEPGQYWVLRKLI